MKPAVLIYDFHILILYFILIPSQVYNIADNLGPSRLVTSTDRVVLWHRRGLEYQFHVLSPNFFRLSFRSRSSCDFVARFRSLGERPLRLRRSCSRLVASYVYNCDDLRHI